MNAPLPPEELAEHFEERPARTSDLGSLVRSLFVAGGRDGLDVEARVVPVGKPHGRDRIQSYEIRLDVKGVHLGRRASRPGLEAVQVDESFDEEPHAELLQAYVPEHLAFELEPRHLVKPHIRIPAAMDPELRYDTTIFGGDDRSVYRPSPSSPGRAQAPTVPAAAATWSTWRSGPGTTTPSGHAGAPVRALHQSASPHGRGRVAGDRRRHAPDRTRARAQRRSREPIPMLAFQALTNRPSPSMPNRSIQSPLTWAGPLTGSAIRRSTAAAISASVGIASRAAGRCPRTRAGRGGRTSTSPSSVSRAGTARTRTPTRRI
jgi:hypothetical protein